MNRSAIVCILGAASALALAVDACSPGPHPAIVAPIASVAPAPSVVAAASARWDLVPTSAWRAHGSIAVRGGKLWFGDDGERWLETADGVTAARELVPDAIAAAQDASGTVRFVGEGGGVWVAKEPLGDVTRTSVGVAHPRSLAASPGALFAIDADGVPQRSVDGRTFAPLVVPNRDGPAVSIAAGGGVTVLASAPLQLFASRDDGASWTAIDPPASPLRRLLAADGALVSDGTEGAEMLDLGSLKFQPLPRFAAPQPKWPSAALFGSFRTDGLRVLELGVLDAKARTWQAAVFTIGEHPAPKHLELLDGCERVDGALERERVVLACDARGTVSGGIDRDAGPTMKGGTSKIVGTPDGGTLGMITRLVRSDDGGQTWREDVIVEGGVVRPGEASIALGDGGWTLLGRRCGTSFASACFPPRLRVSATSPFVELSVEPGPRFERFAADRTSGAVYLIATEGGHAHLRRLRPGAFSPEELGDLGPSSDNNALTLGCDDDGTVRGFVRDGAKKHGFVLRGTSITQVNVPDVAIRAAFAGEHGLASGGSVTHLGWETSDGGVTWREVPLPRGVTRVEGCGVRGCVTERGVRVGWDSPPPAPAKVSRALLAMKGLRCRATGGWAALGDGPLPNVDGAMRGPSRWSAFRADAGGAVALLQNRIGDPVLKTTPLAIFGLPASAHASTAYYFQRGGAIAVRSSYLGGASGFGHEHRPSPVDVSLAWYRDGTAKVSRASFPKLRPFSVDDEEHATHAALPGVVSLGPRGVYFHPPTYDIDFDDGPPQPRTPITLVRDDGKLEKFPFPDDEPVGRDAEVLELAGGPVLLAQEFGIWTLYHLGTGSNRGWSVMAGLEPKAAPMSIAGSGAPVFVASARRPALSWSIPIADVPILARPIALATQRSLGDVMKACTDPAPPSALTFTAPFGRGTRRPVVIDLDGQRLLLVTGRALVRQAGVADAACAAAFEASDVELTSPDGGQDPNADTPPPSHSALFFPNDLHGSVLFERSVDARKTVLRARALECDYAPDPPPESFGALAGFEE